MCYTYSELYNNFLGIYFDQYNDLTVAKRKTLRAKLLLAQIKAGYISNKLKNEIKKVICLLCQQKKITKKMTTI